MPIIKAPDVRLLVANTGLEALRLLGAGLLMIGLAVGRAGAVLIAPFLAGYTALGAGILGLSRGGGDPEQNESGTCRSKDDTHGNPPL